MQKNNHKLWFLLITIILFGFNCGNVFAQVMDIEVLGGGYRLKGPSVIEFPNVTASFNEQNTTVDIRSLDAQDATGIANTDAKNFLWIEDQNGGNQFTVTVSADELTDASSTISIPNDDTPNQLSGMFVKNADDNGGTADIIANNSQSSLNFVSLSPDTNTFQGLAATRALFSSLGTTPGSWRIFPVFKSQIPANTPPGTYTTTLIFTIS
jgi:hypothetical protein